MLGRPSPMGWSDESMFKSRDPSVLLIAQVQATAILPVRARLPRYHSPSLAKQIRSDHQLEADQTSQTRLLSATRGRAKRRACVSQSSGASPRPYWASAILASQLTISGWLCLGRASFVDVVATHTGPCPASVSPVRRSSPSRSSTTLGARAASALAHHLSPPISSDSRSRPACGLTFLWLSSYRGWMTTMLSPRGASLMAFRHRSCGSRNPGSARLAPEEASPPSPPPGEGP
jgi:hypothetical protein